MMQFWKNSSFWMYVITGTTLVIFSTLSILVYLLMMEYIPSELLLISTKHIRPFATVVMIFCNMKALFSILAIFGIRKERPLLIAFYLGYGAFMAIAIFIMALLLLIWLYWACALAAVLFDGLYVFCLVKIYDGYESIVRGKCSDDLEYNVLEEETIDA